MIPPVSVSDLEYPRHQIAFSSNKHLIRFRLAKANYDSANRVPRHGDANVNTKIPAKDRECGGAMKKLSPKFVTFSHKSVTLPNANGVEETRLVPQIIFSLESEVDLGDEKKRDTLYFFLSEWRKAVHDAAGSPAYLQALDEKFGDTPVKHQDAFNRISQICTWKIDLNDAGYPTIVGVELTDDIKAVAAKLKAARDAEMKAFGI